MFTALIIDDDDFSRRLLIEMVNQYFPEIEIVAQASSFYSGIKEIHKHQPNLVFLDIELPDGKGFDIFNLTFTYPFRVIFVTAYKDYAFDVINFSPAGYIVKPITVNSFVNTVIKALPQGYLANNRPEEIKQQITLQSGDKMVIKTLENIHIVYKERIVRCEAFRNYTTIYQQNEKSILASHTLKDFENMLPYPKFLRVHQSHLVNTSLISRIDKSENCIYMEDNSRVPIAYRKKEQLMEYVKLIAEY